jgi:hypothetical protein
MSLNAQSDDAAKSPPLRTADQFPAWKERMTVRCWAIINKNVFDLSNADCKATMKTLDQKDPSKREDWITRVWVILSTSLHDDLLLRVVHIEPGLVHSLIREVETALQVHEPNEAQTLRIELYSAS